MSVKRGLGKGLDALFDIKESVHEENETISEVRISLIEPNPEQPRKTFDDEQLKILSDSISKHGIIQPIIVKSENNGFYRIIAGERRWRAAKMCGLTTVPVIVRDYEEQNAAEIALIENLQREDLNPIEEAEGYNYLMEKFSLTQEQVGEKVGKSRSAVANAVRLLSLSDNLIDMVRRGIISSGHARGLLAIDSETGRQEMAQKIIEEKMSVRELEKAVDSKKRPEGKKEKAEVVPEILDLERKIGGKMGTKVKIKHGKNKGRIEIEYYNMEDLNRIIQILEKTDS